MKNKIMIVALGGTIGSKKGEFISLDENNLKILCYYHNDNVEFHSLSPFSILSESLCVDNWQILFDCIDSIDFSGYDGVIILHGSDTLAYTAAMVGNAYPDKNIVLVAADKPPEDPDSNGVANFGMAVEHLLSGGQGVYVSYDRLMPALCVTSAGIDDKFLVLDSTLPPVNSRNIIAKNVLIANAYVNMDCCNYCLDNVDAVLIGMFHSATVPQGAKDLAHRAKSMGIPCCFVTHRLSADYATARGIDNILTGCTMENAYARMLLD